MIIRSPEPEVKILVDRDPVKTSFEEWARPDLLEDQFGLALVRLENMVRGTICGAIRHKLIPTPQNLVTSTPLTTTYESFFGVHPLSQVLDRTNPLTQIVHGRKSSYLGPGGLTGRTASFRRYPSITSIHFSMNCRKHK